jgi:uncharacterized protein (DUF983 family)
MAKFDKIRALINCKCPRCRVGKVFVGSPYAFRKRRTNEICSHCGLFFEIEPGYFYGAMYISYFMIIIEGGVTGWLVYQISKSDTIWLYLAIILSLTLLLAPLNFRYSRLLLLYYLSPKIKYDPKYKLDLEQ